MSAIEKLPDLVDRNPEPVSMAFQMIGELPIAAVCRSLHSLQTAAQDDTMTRFPLVDIRVECVARAGCRAPTNEKSDDYLNFVMNKSSHRTKA